MSPIDVPTRWHTTSAPNSSLGPAKMKKCIHGCDLRCRNTTAIRILSAQSKYRIQAYHRVPSRPRTIYRAGRSECRSPSPMDIVCRKLGTDASRRKCRQLSEYQAAHLFPCARHFQPGLWGGASCPPQAASMIWGRLIVIRSYMESAH